MNRSVVLPEEIIASASCSAPRNDLRPESDTNCVKHDPMRRLISTPHHSQLHAMGRTLRVETNSPKLLGHLSDLFAHYSYSSAPQESSDFLWRIVVESDVPSSPPWPWRSTFSDEGIRFAQFGQRNFLAVDIDAREAVCFVSEGLFDDTQGFSSPFVDSLFYMTAAPLGLMPFASACVRSENDGLLVMGEPNQGKTTASYLAARDGLKIHSDQSVFLEVADNRLLAWADFVPLAFRPETLGFLPELRSRARLFSYCDFSFYYLPKPEAGSDRRPVVVPACCVFLERGASPVPRLEPFDRHDLRRRLAGHVAFKDDERFEERNRKVLSDLERLPAYRLAYGSDPAEAASFFKILLARHGTGAKPA
jgi:hypothetical protein